MSTESLQPKEVEALRFIRNQLVHTGSAPSLRDISDELDYSSPRSAFLLVESLTKKGFLKRRKPGNELQLIKDLKEHEDHAHTVDVPLVGSAPCGKPFLAEQNLEAMIPVSKRLAKPHNRYFLLRAVGDSMNEAGINDGDLVLVKQQPTAENGQRVVALIDDEATIKELHSGEDSVVLKPRSKNKKHQPIVLTSDFRIQGVVEAVLPKI